MQLDWKLTPTMGHHTGRHNLPKRILDQVKQQQNKVR